MKWMDTSGKALGALGGAFCLPRQERALTEIDCIPDSIQTPREEARTMVMGIRILPSLCSAQQQWGS